MITGSLPAIPTPMQDDGSLDIPALKRMLDWHVAEGTDGIVVVGTTGESPTVDFDEHCLLIKTTVEHIAGRIPVIAGTGVDGVATTKVTGTCGVGSWASMLQSGAAGFSSEVAPASFEVFGSSGFASSPAAGAGRVGSGAEVVAAPSFEAHAARARTSVKASTVG